DMSRGVEACQRLIFQLLPCSQCVLAQWRVCKPFAHECWPIRTERWPASTGIRTKRWPTKALVCKPARFCSQAATHIVSCVQTLFSTTTPHRFSPCRGDMNWFLAIFGDGWKQTTEAIRVLVV